ncbi:hypothetical protein AAVH_23814 [Aphelenchoides avenae]|nr:hypothetical protein AAVH_23814 [Aphelenchus avenae]
MKRKFGAGLPLSDSDNTPPAKIPVPHSSSNKMCDFDPTVFTLVGSYDEEEKENVQAPNGSSSEHATSADESSEQSENDHAGNLSANSDRTDSDEANEVPVDDADLRREHKLLKDVVAGRRLLPKQYGKNMTLREQCKFAKAMLKSYEGDEGDSDYKPESTSDCSSSGSSNSSSSGSSSSPPGSSSSSSSDTSSPSSTDGSSSSSGGFPMDSEDEDLE